MKRRILSIDFDYFIDTDIDTRNDLFPDGVDEKPKDELNKEWSEMYKHSAELVDIGVIDTFETCCNILKNLRFGKVIVADSHKEIASIFPHLNPKDNLEVINIDFHHDNYISGGNNVDCANWVRHLMNKFPQTDFSWYRRFDSELISLEGVFPYKSTTDFVIEGEFDYIFICFSPEWTPPHLYPKFKELCQSVTHLVVD